MKSIPKNHPADLGCLSFFVVLMGGFFFLISCTTSTEKIGALCTTAIYANTIANPPCEKCEDPDNPIERGIGFYVTDGLDLILLIKYVNSNLEHNKVYIIHHTKDLELVSYEKRITGEDGRPINDCKSLN